MTLFLCALGLTFLAILAVDFGWASQDAVRRGSRWWTLWSKNVPGAIADGVVGLVVAVVAGVVLVGRFSDRFSFDGGWERFRYSRGPLSIACLTGVAGGVVFGRLRMLATARDYAKPLHPRWIIQIVACVVAATVLHVCLIEWGSGLYLDAEPPLSAWFGVAAGEMRFMPEQTPGTPLKFGAPIYWIGPRQFVPEHRDLVCFAGGIIAPVVLLCAAVFSLARGLGDARGTGGAPGQPTT